MFAISFAISQGVKQSFKTYKQVFVLIKFAAFLINKSLFFSKFSDFFQKFYCNHNLLRGANLISVEMLSSKRQEQISTTFS